MDLPVGALTWLLFWGILCWHVGRWLTRLVVLMVIAQTIKTIGGEVTKQWKNRGSQPGSTSADSAKKTANHAATGQPTPAP